MSNHMAIYIFHALGNLIIIKAWALFYLSIYKNESFERLCDIAANGHQKGNEVNKVKYPWYRLDRLSRIIFLSGGVMGIAYMCYLITWQMFSWVPMSWENDEGIPVREILAGMLAVYGLTVSLWTLSDVSKRLNQN